MIWLVIIFYLAFVILLNRPIILVSPFVLNIIGKIFNEEIIGISLHPFIFVRTKEMLEDEVLINHEKIHFQQQREMLVIPFYVVYLFEHFRKGYNYISFEMEAYDNEKDMEYLSERPIFNWSIYYHPK